MELHEYANGLREILKTQREDVELLKKQLADAQAEMRRVERAVTALDGEPAVPAPEKAKKAAVKPKEKAWEPNPEMLEKVCDVVISYGDAGCFLGDIAGRLDSTTGTVGRYLTVLREQERVRIAGSVKGQRGAPRALFKAIVDDVDNN